MKVDQSDTIQTLDMEWLQLIQEAMDIGLNADEIRIFFQTRKKPQTEIK